MKKMLLIGCLSISALLTSCNAGKTPSDQVSSSENTSLSTSNLKSNYMITQDINWSIQNNAIDPKICVPDCLSWETRFSKRAKKIGTGTIVVTNNCTTNESLAGKPLIINSRDSSLNDPSFTSETIELGIMKGLKSKNIPNIHYLLDFKKLAQPNGESYPHGLQGEIKAVDLASNAMIDPIIESGEKITFHAKFHLRGYSFDESNASNTFKPACIIPTKIEESKPEESNSIIICPDGKESCNNHCIIINNGNNNKNSIISNGCKNLNAIINNGNGNTNSIINTGNNSTNTIVNHGDGNITSIINHAISNNKIITNGTNNSIIFD